MTKSAKLSRLLCGTCLSLTLSETQFVLILGQLMKVVQNNF